MDWNFSRSASPAGCISSVWNAPLTFSGRQRRAPSGKRQVGSFVYSSFLAADNQLAGTVVIADLYNALFGGCAATCLQGCFIQSQNGCHTTGAPGSGSSHRFATESR